MDNHGVLVGWTHHEMGNKFILNLQTIKQPNTPNDVNRMAVLLTKDQAALLGNYLFQIAGQSPPSSRAAHLVEADVWLSLIDASQSGCSPQARP